MYRVSSMLFLATHAAQLHHITYHNFRSLYSLYWCHVITVAIATFKNVLLRTHGRLPVTVEFVKVNRVPFIKKKVDYLPTTGLFRSCPNIYNRWLPFSGKKKISICKASQARLEQKDKENIPKKDLHLENIGMYSWFQG